MKIIKLSNFSRYPIFGLRPTSPHLTIYRFPLPAILSVVHRGTGIYLYFFIIFLFMMENMCSMDIIDYNIYYVYYIINQSSGILFNLITSTLLFSIYYHVYNGIRHYIWNTGRFLSITGVYSTAYIVLALSVMTTLITIILIS